MGTVKNYRELFKVVLKKIVEEFKLTPKIGIEQEFYLRTRDFDEDLIMKELKNGYDSFQKERGWHQYEGVINFTADLEKLASSVNSSRDYVKQKGSELKLQPDFSAKPFVDDYGSAMQLNLSLHSKNENVFSDGNIEENQWLIHSLGGLMDIALESVYLMCEKEEDYERFKIPEYLNPTHLAWGGNNRSAVFRIPESDPKFRRIEFRIPPAEVDIDKAIFVILLGVYHGLKNKLSPPVRIYGNAFDPVYNLIALPISLEQAKNVYDMGGKIKMYLLTLHKISL